MEAPANKRIMANAIVAPMLANLSSIPTRNKDNEIPTTIIPDFNKENRVEFLKFVSSVLIPFSIKNCLSLVFALLTKNQARNRRVVIIVPMTIRIMINSA